MPKPMEPRPFDAQKSFEILLYLLNSLGGEAPAGRLFSLLCLAECRHGRQYGHTMTGETFIAGRQGPLPLNLLYIYTRIRDGARCGGLTAVFRRSFVLLPGDRLKLRRPPQWGAIPAPEAALLFETVHHCKGYDEAGLYALIQSEVKFPEAVGAGDEQLLTTAVLY
jgi:hypothetical protein